MARSSDSAIPFQAGEEMRSKASRWRGTASMRARRRFSTFEPVSLVFQYRRA
jgi:hypothetical protein